MADQAQNTGIGFQDTGNPVLDSTVNITAGAFASGKLSFKALREIHTIMLELAEKEPGGLKRRGENGALSPRGQKKI